MFTNLDAPCAAYISDKLIFVSYKTVAHIIQVDNWQWNALPSITSRTKHSCGVIRKGANIELVVAGGDSYYQSVQTYVLNSGSSAWVNRNNLPNYGVYYTWNSNVVYKNTFLIVGGYNYNGYYTTNILEMEPNGYFWKIRSEKLDTAAGYIPTVGLAHCLNN